VQTAQASFLVVAGELLELSNSLLNLTVQSGATLTAAVASTSSSNFAAALVSSIDFEETANKGATDGEDTAAAASDDVSVVVVAAETETAVELLFATITEVLADDLTCNALLLLLLLLLTSCSADVFVAHIEVTKSDLEAVSVVSVVVGSGMTAVSVTKLVLTNSPEERLFVGVTADLKSVSVATAGAFVALLISGGAFGLSDTVSELVEAFGWVHTDVTAAGVKVADVVAATTAAVAAEDCLVEVANVEEVVLTTVVLEALTTGELG